MKTILLCLLCISSLLPLSVTAQIPSAWSDTDIGSPGFAGSASYSAGTWTVSGGGGDIWNTSDQFNFCYSNAAVNGVIVAKVTNIQYTDPWAKAGVMFRQDTTPGAMFAMVVATPGNGVSFQWRNAVSGDCGYSQVNGISTPVWVKLVRNGSDFAAFYSLDGAAWTSIGPDETIPFPAAGLVGFAVTAHNDSALCTSTFNSLTISNAPPPVFGIYRELWTNLSPAPGNTLDALTNTTYNPNWPNNPDANYTKIYNTFETEVNTGMNYYGQRLRTFVVPPVTGNYIFWISSDDSSELFVSSDETAFHEVLNAWVAGWTNPREWTREPNQQGTTVALEAGRRYYLEALMQQGQGGDNLAVRWEMPDGSFEEPLSTTSLKGTVLIPCDGVDLPPGIYQQPTNVTVVEGTTAILTLLATNRSALTYQWRTNGVNIKGAAAQKPFYVVSNTSLALNNGQVYTCAISNSASYVISAGATLTVLRDTVPPVVTRISNLGATNVQVAYSKAVELLSATNTANYVFTNGLPVSGASLAADNMTVTLTTSPLVYGSNYTVVISGVRDRASTPNTIAPNTTIAFTAQPLASQDLGTPLINSSVTFVATNGLNLTGAGSDIGGYADQGSFQYQLLTGNFDISVRVAAFSSLDVWAKAGLMVRETLQPGSRFAAALTTPAMNGSFFEWRDPTGSASLASGSFPANYPNTYLRLKRAGNIFTSFAGYDGLNWAQLGSATISLPAQLYFGIILSSHSSSQSAAVQVRDLVNVINPLTSVSVNPHEPLGPSSRKTPIVFSEIMYKPAPRLDGNDVEFLELYNSNPWFQDISGYQVLCDNLNYTVPPGTVLPGGSFLVLAASPSSITAVYGITNILGPYNGSLKKSGTLQLLDETGAVLLTVPYANTSPWPAGADGTGHSLVLANPSYGEGDPRAWDLSDIVGGSPGGMEAFRPSPLRNVVINEFLAHTDPPDYDYVELYNHANQPVDVSGCILTDDSTTNKFVIPAGTSIPARGFLWYTETNMNFRLSAAGETIYFKNPDQSRYLDVVQFGGQENGVATGRWPDGALDFYRLSAKTPGGPNTGIRSSDIVINELMYDPISGNDDDQYIELYNRSTNSVDLTGWTLSDAVSFTFPSNTVMVPDSYLVVARNTARLLTNYPNLNATNCLGNFSGKLSHNGEHLALNLPDTTVQTNNQGVATTILLQILVNDVTYGTGGRWGQWAAGGGSSLELIDPNANTRLAANWADSDETQKALWVNIETTGVLDNGNNYDPSIDYAQIGLLDVGECLVDNLEVRAGTNGPNLVSNPDFETGLGNWLLQGDHVRSSLESTGYLSSQSLHLRCSDRIWTGDNSCEMALNSNALGQGQVATLRFKARWLHGWPEVLLRLNGNWLEATGPLPVPANLGTPGARNSRYVTNAGPAIYQVSHTPAIPAANASVVVTTRVHDPNSVSSLTLYYRLDPAATYTAVTMKDDGTGGDAIAGDGIFSATIPAQPANQIAAFYIAATDTNNTATRFPALLNDGAPVREGVIMFGDSNPAGSFSVYHVWITQTNATRWSQLSDLSNESHDLTFVTGNRVIYDAQGRYAGSPYHQGFDTPYGNLCHYKLTFPDDDVFLGATSFNKLHQPGNGAGDDASLQREQLANTFLRALGVPWLNRRYVAVYVNGNRRGVLMEDAQTPDSDVVKEHFPNDKDGWLYKMQPWFEFGPAPTSISTPFNNCSWCNLMPYTTTGGLKKVARYRYNFLVRRTPDSANDFTNVFSLVDAASSYGTPGYVVNLQSLADMENWMRVFAANHAAGNWDAFGCQNAQNLYGYVGALGTKYSLLMFDFNIVLGNSGSWSPGQNLFTVNAEDPNTGNMFNEPTLRRMYWRALQELVNGPLDVANSGPLLDAKYNCFTANGLSVEDPGSAIKGWLAQAHDSIAAQIAVENAASFTVNGPVAISNNVAYVTGTAPVNVQTIWINGVQYPLIWTSVTGWSVALPLKPGSNGLSIVGVDTHGQPVPGATNYVAAVFSGTLPSPVGQIVINELMYNPVLPGSQFVELYNNSTNITFDLSGWQLQGLSYTFPPGAVIGPNSFLTLTANRAAFGAAYGATIAPFDTFSGTLSASGQTVSLVIPGTNAQQDTIVCAVRYGAAAPWPQAAALSGSSLQLGDPRQDNWRVANWAAAATNPVAAAPQWLFVTTNIPATSSRIYIYLGSAGDIYVDDLSLVGSAGTNLLLNGNFESPLNTTWNFTGNFTNSVLSPLVRHSGNSALHVIATAGGTGSGNAIYQDISPTLTPGATYTLSFWYLQTTNGGPLTFRLPSSLNPATVNPAPPLQLASAATPGSANAFLGSLTPFPPLWLNELQADNLTGITNRSGQRTPWVELYNPTTNPVALFGLYLAKSYTNLNQWAFPTGSVINPGQFKIIFADSQTNLSTAAELHTSFTLPSGAGSLALSRLSTNAQLQVLDFIDYTNLTPDHSYGSFPDGQVFTRQEFYHVTPGAANDGTSFPSSVSYASDGWVYQQDFNSLPNPGATSVNTANPVTINGVTYSLANPYDFAFPPAPGGGTGGLGLVPLAGWYGWSQLDSKFGATDGDQTTGGQLSFGPPNGTNRALGLLATSTTGSTAFGLRLVNKSTETFNNINLQFTGELWRQSDKPKSLQFYYALDLSSTNRFPINATAFVPSLNVNFPTAAADVGGVAVDGTAPANQTNLMVSNQLITNWPPGAALWLVWEMADAGGKAQGLAIDNLGFSASATLPNTPPILAPIPDQYMFLGQTLNFTATATDNDKPSQTLTFSLDPGAPTNVILYPASGIFSWTPLSAQTPSTNRITLRVTDNGVPPLSAAQTFTVTVSIPPAMNLNGTTLQLGWPSLPGKVYRLQYTDDLSAGNWNAWGADIPGTGNPIIVTVDTTGAQRFYRLAIIR